MRPTYGQVHSVDKEILTSARRMGMDRVQFNLPHDLPADRLWKYEDLIRFRNTYDRYGVVVEVVENMPISFYDKAMLRLEGGDRQIENVCESIRSLGQAGIPVLGYHFSPSFVRRTDSHAPVGRYEATIRALDLEMQKQGMGDMDDFEQKRDVTVPDVELLWENFEYFMERVISIAEEHNVIMALHPDDPSVKSLSSIVRMFVDLDSYERAEVMIDSPNWGLLLCIGIFSQTEDGTRNIFDATKYLGPRKKLVYTYMRDVRGTVPKFQECFLGEGDFDSFEVVYRLIYSGFNGFLVSDHIPDIEGDRGWGHRVRYTNTAYIRGLTEAIEKMETVKRVQKNLWMVYCAWIKDGKEG